MWNEVIFIVDRDHVDAWSDALLECGAASVQAEDADEGAPDEQAIFGEPGEPPPAQGWRRTRLSAMVGPDIVAAELLAAAAALCGACAPATHTLRAVPELDWVRLTQAQFSPIPVGTRLWITPSWHLSQDAGTRLPIVLDPGLAFGTGSHPTTRMCLEWLDANLPPAATVVDYGCGSGILAIAAARLGAAQVQAIDIDPQAIESTRENARINRVTVQAGLPAELRPAPADVVLANILANPLRMLAPLLSKLVRPGGSLVLAGLLDRQADEIAACYPDIALEPWLSREGWTCLAGRRRE
ncbi:MAG: 50S ribosomal protein L11 methyltransferase [Burkholderiaceae bacterium]